MLGIPIGLLVGNATEWIVHKYVLHGLGKKKDSFWSFHFHEHHRNSYKHDFLDEEYTKPLFKSIVDFDAQGKEFITLFGSALLHLPLLPVFPFYTLTIFYCAYNYYTKHKKAHLDPEWARQNLPWHYKHHLPQYQNKNWCVTKPVFDKIMRTYVK